MSEYTYSIITAHYNTPELLKEMLDSIPDRRDIQLIVVDDNSFDDPCELESELGSEVMGRIELYHNPSDVHGAGRCRNEGLSHAKGKWVLFVDADDILTENAFEILDRYKDAAEDIVYFVPQSLVLPDMTEGSRHRTYEKLIKEYLKDPSAEDMVRYRLYAPWSKLIRRELLDKLKIRFDSSCWSEDVMFSVKAAYYADKIAACADPVYIITQRQQSLTTHVSAYKYQVSVWVYVREYLFLKDRLDEETFKKVAEWPGGKIVRALMGGYGLPMVRYILRLYKKYGIEIKLKDMGSEYIKSSLEFLANRR